MTLFFPLTTPDKKSVSASPSKKKPKVEEMSTSSSMHTSCPTGVLSMLKQVAPYNFLLTKVTGIAHSYNTIGAIGIKGVYYPLDSDT